MCQVPHEVERGLWKYQPWTLNQPSSVGRTKPGIQMTVVTARRFRLGAVGGRNCFPPEDLGGLYGGGVMGGSEDGQDLAIHQEKEMSLANVQGQYINSHSPVPVLPPSGGPIS